MEEKQTLICDKCNVGMEDKEVQFKYLNRSFRHKVKRCPKCGQVYIPEDLAEGRMKEVEGILEEK
ncbi:DVU_1557 family redox protein [Anaerovorax odorimutans]|uniref:DVU_1557 family redox protein n=1 Tax=Anaerovorax odorimutans TaxID=109327 RepID=UPI0004051FF1|nr:CLJU_RS11820 family redox protein [Anaerovorax odorimutans]